MSGRTYPRTVWVLMPSFKPMSVEVVGPYGMSYHDYGDVTAKGKCYAVAAMHDSQEQAIATGRAEVERLRADIAKRTENMNKRIAELDKAEGK